MDPYAVITAGARPRSFAPPPDGGHMRCVIAFHPVQPFRIDSRRRRRRLRRRPYSRSIAAECQATMCAPVNSAARLMVHTLVHHSQRGSDPLPPPHLLGGVGGAVFVEPPSKWEKRSGGNIVLAALPVIFFSITRQTRPLRSDVFVGVTTAEQTAACTQRVGGPARYQTGEVVVDQTAATGPNSRQNDVTRFSG